MAEAYLGDQKRILPCAVYVERQVRSRRSLRRRAGVIGAAASRRSIEIALDDEAKPNFQVSVDAVKELLEACKGIDGSSLRGRSA